MSHNYSCDCSDGVDSNIVRSSMSGTLSSQNSNSNGNSNVSAPKSVDFKDALKVVLIPSRCEYKEAGLCDQLWWKASEFRLFQQQSFSEIMWMAKDENLDVRAARRKLYQPSLDEDRFNHIVDACEEIENGDVTANRRQHHPYNRHQPSGIEMASSMVAQSPRRLVKAPTKWSEDDDEDNKSSDTSFEELSSPSSPGPTRNRTPLQKRLFAVSSLQNLSAANHSSSLSLSCYDEMDPFLSLEEDALSLCVPLDEHYSVEFERKSSTKKTLLAKRLKFNFPSLTTISIFICGIFILLCTFVF